MKIKDTKILSKLSMRKNLVAVYNQHLLITQFLSNWMSNVAFLNVNFKIFTANSKRTIMSIFNIIKSSQNDMA